MRVQYRPLAFYGVMEGLALVSRGVLASMGFRAARVGQRVARDAL